MFRVLICICWQTENKNRSRISVRYCSKCFKLSLKNIQAAGKKKNFSEAQLIEEQTRLIENRRKTISAEFKSGPSSRKYLGFQSKTPKYKRKALTSF